MKPNLFQIRLVSSSVDLRLNWFDFPSKTQVGEAGRIFFHPKGFGRHDCHHAMRDMGHESYMKLFELFSQNP